MLRDSAVARRAQTRLFVLVALLAVFAAPLVAGAQPATRIPRVGLLSPAPPAAAAGMPYDAFREALRELTDGGDPAVRAALNATKTIPIVMGTVSDPVAAGVV